MHYHVLTLFPEMITQGLGTSIIGRAMEQGIIELTATNIRDFSTNKHMKVDDYPYGGGAGMVMQAQPVYDAYQNVVESIGYRPRVIYLTPQGKVFNQSMVEDYAKEKDLVFLCGHYEGVDQRVIDLFIDEELSIGDFVLTGGEIPAMAVVDAVCRYVDGVINGESLEQESFSNGMLEYPHYTRPQEFMGLKVPEVLTSGHHGNVEKWRAEKSREITLKNRPDLLQKENK